MICIVIICAGSRDVAQFGRALSWGGRGREFKSRRSDHNFVSPTVVAVGGFLILRRYTMHGIYLIAVMVVVGGAIAFIGDKLGTKIGKKRLSMFGLRPRHTSMIITVLTGSLITGLSIGTMAVVSQDVRTALFGMEELNSAMAATKQTLNEVTDELFRMNDEYKRADAALMTSKEEIAALKIEQEDLLAESEELRIGNDKLAEEKAELTAENENLASSNFELESNNKQLSEFNITLTADNKKLADDKAELEEHTKNLREGLIAIREGDIAFRAGEILSTGVLKGGRSPEEVTEDINRLIETASRNIAERFGESEDNSVWIYQPDLQNIIETVSSNNQDMILRITAAGNLVRGEPVRTKLNIFPNNLVYSKNEFVFAGNYEVKNISDSDKIIGEFLAGVNRAAVTKGILPDPITGTIGAMSSEQLYEIADAIENAHGKIQLAAYAREDTTSIGPLRLNVRLMKAE